MLPAPADDHLPPGDNFGLGADDLRIIFRSSTRARRLILRLLSADTLEVVLPEGVRGVRLPALLTKYAAWICEARQRRVSRSEEREWGIPSTIDLRAIRELWKVQTIFAFGTKVRLAEQSAGCLLELRGRIDRADLWSLLLQTWLKQKANQLLIPWLERIAIQTGLDYRRATIRLQRSRWGSCSSRQHLNLNARLLLVPPELVDYLLIHELCHTRELNHSERFWKLVGRHCPEYKVLDRRLNLASRELPLWSHLQAYS